MNEEEKEAIEILQGLCTDDCVNNDIVKTIVKLIEKQQKEIERINEILIWKQEHEEQLQKEIEELYISKDKIKELIKEKAKTDTYNFRTIAIKDIKELLGE